MVEVPFSNFDGADVARFERICRNQGYAPEEFRVLGILKSTELSSISAVKIEYLRTGRTIEYPTGQSMSWLVFFEIDLQRALFLRPSSS